MRTLGWILIVFGSVSAWGSITHGRPPAGLVLIVFGAYMLHRAKEKEIEQDNKEKWKEGQK